MRTWIMMVVMVAMGFASTAGERECAISEEAVAAVGREKGEAGLTAGADGRGSCSFTVKGSVNTPVVSFDFSCTATEETCRQAILKARECASLAIKLLRDQFSF